MQKVMPEIWINSKFEPEWNRTGRFIFHYFDGPERKLTLSMKSAIADFIKRPFGAWESGKKKSRQSDREL